MVTVKTAPSAASLKRRAKALSKSENITHTAALDLAAKQAGYTNYRNYQSETGQLAQNAQFIVKIDLAGCTLPISRTISVPVNLTFEQLHGAIQLAMGWLNAHLYQFEFPGWTILTDAETANENQDRRDPCYTDAALETLNTYYMARMHSFRYVYDFGDNWKHDVKILEKTTTKGHNSSITLLEATGQCPPEDAGGLHRFNEILESFSNEDDSEAYAKQSLFDQAACEVEREEIAEWLGETYNPYNPVSPARHSKALKLFTECGYNFSIFADVAGWDETTNGFNPNIHYDRNRG